MEQKFVVIFAGSFLLTATSTYADEGVIKYRNVHQNKEWHSIAINEDANHILGFYENHGVSFQEDGEIVPMKIKGTLDHIENVGSAEGYEIRNYDDGSMIILKFKGESIEGGDNDGGTYVCVSGAGRFEGITCTGVWEGGQKGPAQVYDAEIKYTLP